MPEWKVKTQKAKDNPKKFEIKEFTLPNGTKKSFSLSFEEAVKKVDEHFGKEKRCAVPTSGFIPTPKELLGKRDSKKSELDELSEMKLLFPCTSDKGQLETFGGSYVEFRTSKRTIVVSLKEGESFQSAYIEDKDGNMKDDYISMYLN